MVFSSELFAIVAPALVAGLLVAFTHGPLGVEVLRRGIIFIDLATAQIAGLGLVGAQTFWPAAQGPLAFVLQQGGALLCALAAGLFFRKVERTAPAQLEAIIGISFVVAASVVILLLANQPQGGEDMQHLLSGQLLFAQWPAVLGHGGIYAGILALWFFKPTVRQGTWFYGMFALAVTSSVQLVGVYVVFVSLVVPAVATASLVKQGVGLRAVYVAGWLQGVVAVLLGVGFSLVFDAPTGPVLVLAYVLVAVFYVACCKIKKLNL